MTMTRPQEARSVSQSEYKGNYNNLILYIYLKGNKIPINFSTKMYIDTNWLVTMYKYIYIY